MFYVCSFFFYTLALLATINFHWVEFFPETPELLRGLENVMSCQDSQDWGE